MGVAVPLSRSTMYDSDLLEPDSDLRGMVEMVPSTGVSESVGQTRTHVSGRNGSGTCGLASQ